MLGLTGSAEAVVDATADAVFAVLTSPARLPGMEPPLDSPLCVSVALPLVKAYQDASRSTKALDALGDGTRRAILELLAEKPRAVVDLAAGLPVTRPAVSLHLRVLSDAGLVTHHAVGTRRVYRLEASGIAGLRTYLDALWSAALDRFATVAEAAHAEGQESESGVTGRRTHVKAGLSSAP